MRELKQMKKNVTLLLVVLTTVLASCSSSKQLTRSTGPNDPSGFVLLSDAVPDAILTQLLKKFVFVKSMSDK